MKSISDQSVSGATTTTSMASLPSISAIMTMANAIQFDDGTRTPGLKLTPVASVFGRKLAATFAMSNLVWEPTRYPAGE